LQNNLPHNALDAHARDELGIIAISGPKQLQAATSSGVAFTVVGSLPVLVALLASLNTRSLLL
jgi:hypothetical protein